MRFSRLTAILVGAPIEIRRQEGLTKHVHVCSVHISFQLRVVASLGKMTRRNAMGLDHFLDGFQFIS